MFATRSPRGERGSGAGRKARQWERRGTEGLTPPIAIDSNEPPIEINMEAKQTCQRETETAENKEKGREQNEDVLLTRMARWMADGGWRWRMADGEWRLDG